MKRDYTMKTRLTDAEREILEDRAKRAGVSMADYVRAAVFGFKHMRQLPGAEELVESRRLIKNIADNVNQVAKAMNSAKAAGKLDGAIANKNLQTLAQLHQKYKSDALGISEFMVGLDRQ